MIDEKFVAEEGKTFYTFREIFLAARKHFEFECSPENQSTDDNRKIYDSIKTEIERSFEGIYNSLSLKYSHVRKAKNMIDSRVVELLLNVVLYEYFINKSIELNKKYIESHANKDKTLESKEILQRLEVAKEKYKVCYSKPFATSINDYLLEEELLDQKAEQAEKVLHFHNLGLTIEGIPQEDIDQILALPDKEKQKLIARQRENEQRKLDYEIEEMVEQAKQDIVFDYITKHCISIDEEKLRNDISMEYASESIPAHPVELENRLRLQDLSNYYTVINPKENQDKRES